MKLRLIEQKQYDNKGVRCFLILFINEKKKGQHNFIILTKANYPMRKKRFAVLSIQSLIFRQYLKMMLLQKKKFQRMPIL